MSTIIAAKYGGPCIKCGKKIKAGSFVNWDRGRGIWHLDETDNKKLGSSMLDPTAQEAGDSTTAIVTEKNRLRDITKDVDTCTTIDELKALSVKP